MSDQPTATWITESDLDLLITLADCAHEFVINWALLDTNDAVQAAERLHDLASDLLPLLQQYDERFPQTPVDQPIPYTIPTGMFVAAGIGAIN